MLDTFQNQESLGLFFFARTFCIYRLFLTPDTLMSFVHLELTTAAKVNVMSFPSQHCCYTVDTELYSGLGSSWSWVLLETPVTHYFSFQDRSLGFKVTWLHEGCHRNFIGLWLAVLPRDSHNCRSSKMNWKVKQNFIIHLLLGKLQIKKYRISIHLSKGGKV